MKNWITALFTIFTLTVMFGVITAKAGLVDDWSIYKVMPSGQKIHALVDFTDPKDGRYKLAIAEGSGQAEGQAVVRFYDGQNNTLTTSFQAPLGTYTGTPYWRSLAFYGGNLYAGLGNNTMLPPDGPVDTGEVWQYDGNSWQMVLQTDMNDVYTMLVYNGKLYAGTGRKNSKAGQLWVTDNGVNWQFLRSFPNDFVRSLAIYQGQLYLGLKQPADVWSYDGNTFTEHGPPPGIGGALSQVKTMVPSPDGSLLYLAGVEAKIWTWNGVTYKLSIDLTGSEAEIYKGVVYNSTIFFPTHSQANNHTAGDILRLINGQWSVVYSTTPAYGQIQVLQPYQGYLYAGGSANKDGLAPLYRALYE